MSKQTSIATEKTLKSVFDLVNKVYAKHQDVDKIGDAVRKNTVNELKPYCKAITDELSTEAKNSIDSAKAWAEQVEKQASTVSSKVEEISEYAKGIQDVLTKAQSLQAITATLQNTISEASHQISQTVDEFKAIKESLSNVVNYKGSVETYNSLPTENHLGDMYNVNEADETHKCKAGDNFIWNGTEWDNVGGFIDVDSILRGGNNAVLGNVDAATITAASFVGPLAGKASTAGTADRALRADICTGNAATASAVAWTNITEKPSTFSPSSHSHSWDSITEKPTSFIPTDHDQAWSTITDKPAQATRWPKWSEVTDKPTSMPANGGTADVAKSANAVAWDNVAGRPNSMAANGGTSTYANKINVNCNNEIVLNRNGQSNGGAYWIGYRNEGSTAAITEYKFGDGLSQGGLASVTAKTFNGSLAWENISSKPTSFTPTSHTHAWSQISGKPSSLPANGGTADNSNKLNGIDLNTLKHTLGGNKTPALTNITGNIYALDDNGYHYIRVTEKYSRGSNEKYECYRLGKYMGYAEITQSIDNFDGLLVQCCFLSRSVQSSSIFLPTWRAKQDESFLMSCTQRTGQIDFADYEAIVFYSDGKVYARAINSKDYGCLAMKSVQGVIF